MSKNNKKGKDKKASKPSKASKPAPKKAAKPAPKKVVKKVASKPAKKAAPAKPAAKSAGKKDTKKSAPAKAEKEIKKPNPAPPKKGDKKAGKEKKTKPAADELEAEGMDIGEDIEGLELDGDVVAEDDLLEEEEVVKPKAKGGRKRKRRGDDDDDDHIFDSDNLMRKQQVKIDLSKSLIRKGQQEQPKPFVNTSDKRTRYNDSELAEFKELILEKLKEAETDYELLKSTLSNKDNHGTDDTSPTFKLLEDGSDVLSKEETAQLAARQEKYIISLRNALVRIENKSYGICRVTGKLIPKERLRSVPHATLGIDAKLNQHNN
jgi:DnaK suppressor protein